MARKAGPRLSPREQQFEDDERKFTALGYRYRITCGTEASGPINPRYVKTIEEARQRRDDALNYKPTLLPGEKERRAWAGIDACENGNWAPLPDERRET